MQKKRVVIAGQIPPPQGGQNIMIAQILDELRKDDAFETVHWPFFFSRNLESLRRFRFGKIVELLRCLWRLLRIRRQGDVDLLIYPAGGPHLVPIIRDIFLLPFARLVSRKLVIQFHAAGIAAKSHLPARILRFLMRSADSAIVMANYNRVDPESAGLRKIDILPYRIADKFSPPLMQQSTSRLLYIGHLTPDKGTPQLLEAFGNISRDFPELRLELVGEPLIPYDLAELRKDLGRFGVENAVDISGVLIGEAKLRALGRADLFVFPTVAPYESFGVVLLEAMMFGLPIVASDWRGNRDVLGDFGGVLFSPNEPLAKSIEEALRRALLQLEQWSTWGRKNRARFQSHFARREGQSDYVDLVRRQLELT